MPHGDVHRARPLHALGVPQQGVRLPDEAYRRHRAAQHRATRLHRDAGAPNSVYNYAETRGEAELEEAADEAFDDGTTIGDPANGIACRNDGKFIVYTNSVDFRLVDIREIGVLAYNHDLRVWELTLAHQKTPIRLKRNVNSDMLLALNSQLVRVSQKHIINIGYLMEVTNNTCRFYPPFDKVEDVKVGRLFRKKLIDQFCNL